MTKPTGRPRGRPKKITLQKKHKSQRGRPSIDLWNDPDRYAIVFWFVFRKLMGLSERAAAIEAGRILLPGARPETIRAKARKAWQALRLRQVDELTTLHWGDLRADPTLGRALWRHFWKTVDWQKFMANAVWITLESDFQASDQSVTRMLVLAERAGERRFARKVLLPHMTGKNRIYMRSQGITSD